MIANNKVENMADVESTYVHEGNLELYSSLEFTLVCLVVAVVCVLFLVVARRRCKSPKKFNTQQDIPFPFQQARRPTAVRSPNGQPPQYLKKTPSPTGGKQLNLLSPMQDPSIVPISPQKIKFTTENEAQPRHMTAGEKRHSPIKHNAVQHISSSNVMNGGIQVIEEPLMPPAIADGHDQIDGVEQYGKLGTIYFKLRYERKSLIVSIIRCRGLPCKGAASGNGDATAGMNGRTQLATDPYVKLQLLPDRQHKVKTRVVRNTSNPVYDEDFTFYKLDINQLQTMSLHFIVLSYDRYSRDDVIGEVVFPLNSIDIGGISKEALSISKEIQPRSLKMRTQARGEILISLCWQPAAARLTVVLLKARNLPRMDVTGLADPYVKIYLLFNGQRIAKKKTHVKKRTLSPVFNESFAFEIPDAEGAGASLENVSLEVTLLDWDRVTKNEVIGRLDLGGPKSTGTALNHWEGVCSSPRRQIAEWHKLTE